MENNKHHFRPLRTAFFDTSSRFRCVPVRSRLHNPLCIVHPIGAGMVLLRCKVHEEKVVSVCCLGLCSLHSFMLPGFLLLEGRLKVLL